jgi:hypothetical protein
MAELGMARDLGARDYSGVGRLASTPHDERDELHGFAR